jgi:hypothetical protein
MSTDTIIWIEINLKVLDTINDNRLIIGSTEVAKAKGTKKVPWHLDEFHQRALNQIKATIAKEVVLAYPDYSKVFDIYTDASSKQLRAVITQDNRAFVFFS